MNNSPKCPICSKPPQPHLAPFCSKACADRDLHRWLAGVYVVPSDETPEALEDYPQGRSEDNGQEYNQEMAPQTSQQDDEQAR